MATKPTAARGKVTRKERFKRKVKDIMDRSLAIKDPDMNMSPGAMGGRTPRKFNPPKLMSTGMSPVAVRNMGKKIMSSLDKLQKQSDDVSKKLFKDGGEVMDLTTEIDV